MLAIIKARADTAVTAERIRVIVQQIYNHAIRSLLVTTNPAQPVRGAIARAPVEHHRHLNEKELGAFWRKLDEQGAHTTTVAATKLLLLTMMRRRLGARGMGRTTSEYVIDAFVNSAATRSRTIAASKWQRWAGAGGQGWGGGAALASDTPEDTFPSKGIIGCSGCYNPGQGRRRRPPLPAPIITELHWPPGRGNTA